MKHGYLTTIHLCKEPHCKNYLHTIDADRNGYVLNCALPASDLNGKITNEDHDSGSCEVFDFIIEKWRRGWDLNP